MCRTTYVLIALIAVVRHSSAAEPVNTPNIVLVMADDQGWGDMAYNGHPHLKTPHFDAMAKEALRFDLFHAAAPVCSPTRASVLTGRTPNRMATFKWGHPIRPQETTLAQVLKGSGYRTGHFGKWHIGSVQKDGLSTPGKCGFDDWVSAPNFYDLDPVLSDKGKAVAFKGDSSDVTADLAVKFMRDCAAKKQPFLAVVWFGSPHDPHRALPDDRKPYADRPAAEQNFLGEITAMDRAFGRVRAEIKELGLRDNTVLWYCSDNGALPKLGSSGGRRGNKGLIYEGGLLVPALLEWPAKYPKPRVIDVPCVTSDIYPTVLAMTAAKADRQPPLDGINLLPILDGKAMTRSKPIGFWDHPTPGMGTPAKAWMDELLAEQTAGREPTDPKKLFSDAGKITMKYPLDRFPGHAAWLDGSWKLHRIESAKSDGVKWELYDLAADPKESRDLLATEAKRTEMMKKELTAWLESVARSLNGEDYPMK
ncbi:MAG: N-acetylgalactosamine 6-sulfate sulfatase [Planctomycetaceae bacterium]|nr:N-acetylgalactosamine 6-sulfate sulfatase [Planctomycetaceae bacterium]